MRRLKAAHTAFGKWSKIKAKDRKKLLLKVAALIEKYGDEIAVTECLDAGQALKIVRGQIARAAENFSFYAEWAERAMDGRTFPVDHDWLNYSVRVPVGCVRNHHAVERAADALHMANCAGFGNRKHGDFEAGGMVATDRC